MTRQELVRLGGLAVATVALSMVVALSLAHTQAGSSFAQEMDGALAIDCSAELDGVQSECDVESGGEFTIQVHVIEPPAGGYATVQVKPTWTDGVVDYQPAASEEDENLWSVCADDALVFVRYDNAHPPATLGPPPETHPSFVYSCLPMSVTTDPSLTWTDTGAIFQFSFVCQTDEEATIGLIPHSVDGETDAQEGTNFVVPDETAVNLSRPVNPESISGATVNCGAAVAGDIILPEVGVSGIDAAGKSSLWASIGLLIAAAGAGVIVLGWRKARSR